MQYQCQPAGKELAGGRRRGVTMVKKTKEALTVYIVQAGTVRKVELPDPRKAFCAEINRHAATTGIRAVTQIPRRSA
jgi:hypothetical protein